MTANKALYDFFNSFGVPAYPTTGVPQRPQLPYLTFQPAFGYWEDTANITVQLWMLTESEAAINAKAKAIGDAIGTGKVIRCDGGAIWMTRGNPWCVPATVQDEPKLKLRQMNVRIEFLTV